MHQLLGVITVMGMQLKSRRSWVWAPVLSALLAAGGASAQTPAGDAASVAKGKRLFLRCAACHDIGESGLARVGPSLKGVLGRPAGTLPGFNYSADMKTQTFSWDAARLDAWLEKPTAVVPGTAMAFIGIPSAAERKALIDYLSTLK
jgi:cytochrome c